MTAPPCPRCGAPTLMYSLASLAVRCDSLRGCRYGHDAPRTLVPQPDRVGVARPDGVPCEREMAILDVLMRHLQSKSPAFVAWEINRALEQPAPTPAAQHNATSAGVDEGMRKMVAGALYDARSPKRDWYAFADAAIAAILATHEIVRRHQ